MQEIIINIFGSGRDLSTLQICARAFIMFFIALLLIRVGGLRLFGNKSAFDNVIVIMLGAVLSRGVTGASGFINVVAAGAVMILTNRMVAALSTRFKKLAVLFEGEAILLYADGVIMEHNLRRANISKEELVASVRLETKKDDFETIEKAYLETNGRISFVHKEKAGQKTKMSAVFIY